MCKLEWTRCQAVSHDVDSSQWAFGQHFEHFGSLAAPAAAVPSLSAAAAPGAYLWLSSY